MSMMLTRGDIEYMKNSVRDVIDQWNTSITIMQPLPIDKQPNYNPILGEFTGDVAYETISISAERKDIVNNHTNNLPEDDTEYGEKNAGTILYAIPNILPVFNHNGRQVGVRQFKPHKQAVIAIDDTDDRYYISSMRDRIGEVLITIKRYVGDIPDGSLHLPKGMIPIDGLIDTETFVEDIIDESIPLEVTDTEFGGDINDNNKN